MLSDQQRKFWRDYISLIGEQNFSIRKTSSGNSIVSSKFFCGIDPSDAEGGGSIVGVAINRAKEYNFITSKNVLTYSDFQTILLTCVQSQFYHLELDHFLPKLLSTISNQQHWDLIKNCWQMQEFTSSFDRVQVWRRIFSLRKPNAKLVDRLPDQFVAYRAGDLSGFSWTLDKDIAQWFANRFSEEFGNVEIHQKQFKKTNAIMFIETRNEKEVVILPK